MPLPDDHVRWRTTRCDPDFRTHPSKLAGEPEFGKRRGRLLEFPTGNAQASHGKGQNAAGQPSLADRGTRGGNLILGWTLLWDCRWVMAKLGPGGWLCTTVEKSPLRTMAFHPMEKENSRPNLVPELLELKLRLLPSQGSKSEESSQRNDRAVFDLGVQCEASIF